MSYAYNEDWYSPNQNTTHPNNYDAPYSASSGNYETSHNMNAAYGFEPPSFYTSPSQSGFNGGVPMRQSQSLSSDSSYNSNNSYLQGLSSPASSPEGYPRDQYEQRIPIVFDVARSKSRAKSDKSSLPAGKTDQYVCLQPGCEHRSKRQFDLDRHIKTNHNTELKLFDCPGRGCGRQGEHGFKRKDHMTEHLRKVHKKDAEYPKVQTRRKDSLSPR